MVTIAQDDAQNLLPITFLRQLIRFYGDSIQNLIPTYLDFSIESLVREQEKFRGQMTNAFGPAAFGPASLSDTVRRNTEMFEQAMRMFLPFGGGVAGARPGPAPSAPASAEPQAERSDFDQLRRQLEDKQRRLDKIDTRLAPARRSARASDYRAIPRITLLAPALSAGG
jgi:polyhydroxyalkanoate synthesis regulator protein